MQQLTETVAMVKQILESLVSGMESAKISHGEKVSMEW
jgi:hypothetical protein